MSLASLVLSLSACPGADDTGGTENDSGPADTGCVRTACATTTSPVTLTAGSSSTDTSATSTTSGDGADSTSTSTSGPMTDSGGSDTAGGSDSGGTGDGVTQVVFETTLGDIVIALDEAAAPITSANFLAYVDAGFYDGTDGFEPTIVHRVVPGFVIQGGGLTETLMPKATMPPIVNESGNGLSNLRGTVAMARTMDPDSATSQFFVNLVDNAFLDNPPGYAVFGEVVQGMDIVDAIAAVPTETVGPFEGVPVDPIIVLSTTVQ